MVAAAAALIIASASEGVAVAADLSSLNDEFSGTSLDPSWSVLDPELLSISESAGRLHLQAVPGQDSVWYLNSTKELVWKTVTATNFRVTATVFPRKRTDPTQAPTHALHVGGVMARNPDNSAGENYVFIMMGSNESAVPGVETKSTTNNNSVFEEPAWSNPLSADLRICRVGSAFQLYKRIPASPTWTLATTYNRPDLPATLQVGPALNYGGADNDLDVAFERITFAPIFSAADCTSDVPAVPVPAVPPLALAALGLALALTGAFAWRRVARA